VPTDHLLRSPPDHPCLLQQHEQTQSLDNLLPDGANWCRRNTHRRDQWIVINKTRDSNGTSQTQQSHPQRHCPPIQICLNTGSTKSTQSTPNLATILPLRLQSCNTVLATPARPLAPHYAQSRDAQHPLPSLGGPLSAAHHLQRPLPSPLGPLSAGLVVRFGCHPCGPPTSKTSDQGRETLDYSPGEAWWPITCCKLSPRYSWLGQTYPS
jgi:hypothetical protein